MTHTQEALYQKLALMHMTKIAQFDRSAAFECFWCHGHYWTFKFIFYFDLYFRVLPVFTRNRMLFWGLWWKIVLYGYGEWSCK